MLRSPFEILIIGQAMFIIILDDLSWRLQSLLHLKGPEGLPANSTKKLDLPFNDHL